MKSNKTFRLSEGAILGIEHASELSGMTRTSFLEWAIARGAFEWHVIKNYVGAVGYFLGLSRASLAMSQEVLDGHPVREYDSLIIGLLQVADEAYHNSDLDSSSGKIEIPPLEVRRVYFRRMVTRLRDALNVWLEDGKWEVQED